MRLICCSASYYCFLFMSCLVIFDLDGVLVDTEKLYMDMNLAWFKSLGFEMPQTIYLQFIGASGRLFWQYIVDVYKLSLPVEQYILAEKALKFKTLQKANLTPTPHLLPFLQFLKTNRVPCAIASSGLRQNIDLILQKTKLRPYFTTIISGEQVARGKPHPDIFELAAHEAGHLPKECIVIEDSFNGVTAAKAANMFCVGFYNPNSGNQNLSAANMIINSFAATNLYQMIIKALEPV